MIVNNISTCIVSEVATESGILSSSAGSSIWSVGVSIVVGGAAFIIADHIMTKHTKKTITHKAEQMIEEIKVKLLNESPLIDNVKSQVSQWNRQEEAAINNITQRIKKGV